jgi:ribosomal protein S19
MSRSLKKMPFIDKHLEKKVKNIIENKTKKKSIKT